jgi:transcriptional regulator with XRE-family HTH domain
MSLGDNIKFLRESRKLTYDAVGKAVGTDGQNIFNLEKRRSKVSTFAPKLAEFFGVDLAELQSEDLSKKYQNRRPALKFEVAESHAQYNDDRPHPDEIIELIALFSQATPRGRENILDLARGAAKRGTTRWAKVGDDKL